MSRAKAGKSAATRKRAGRSGLTKSSGRVAKTARGSETLVNRLKQKETPEESRANMVVSGLETNAVTVARFSQVLGDVDLTECVFKLDDAVERVHQGDLRASEALLTSQAVALNAIFTHLANVAVKSEYLDKFERSLRLALKAQSQCRTTIETLAEVKNPRAVFVRQANVAHGPQQVNNAVRPPSREEQPVRAENQENAANRTIEGS